MRVLLLDNTERSQASPMVCSGDTLVPRSGDASTHPAEATNIIWFTDYLARVPDLFGATGVQLREWSNRPLGHGGPFKTAIQVRGFALWWMFDTHLLHGSINPAVLHEVFREIRALRALISDLRPSELVYLGTDHEFATVVAVCAEAAGIPGSAPNLSSLAGLKRSATSTLIGGAYWAQFLLRKLVFAFQRLLQRPSRGDSRPEVFVVSRDDWETVQDLDSGALCSGERHYQTIFDSLKADFRFFFAVHLHNSRIWLKRPLEKRRMASPFVPIESAVGLLPLVREYVGVRRRWRLIRDAPGFSESLQFEGVNCAPLLLPRFEAFFKTALVEALTGLLAADALLERERPSVMLHGLETSGVGRAFLFFARKHGIPSVVLQHGTITPLHPAGTPDPRDVDLSYRDSAAWPFPDVMALYGEFGRRAMIESNWPPELLRVTGAPRWDFSPMGDQFYSRAQTCARLGLDADKPVFSFLGTNLPREESMTVTRTVCRALRKVEGAQLIVKLHPFDRCEAATMEVLRQEGFAATHVFRKGTVVEFVVASDVVLSVGSTAVIESALIGRPIVVVDPAHRGYANLFPYEFVKTADNSESLAAILSRWLDGEPYRSQWMSERDAFVADQCFRADGQATARLCQLLRFMIDSGPRACPGVLETIPR